MKAYSIDLRKKIVQSVRKGISKSETARRFDVNRSTVQRYIKQLDEGGSLAPKKRPGSHPKLDESALLVLEQDLESRPWATHRQRSEFLYGICGVEVSEATICRAIKRGLYHSRKKINRSQRAGRVAEVGVALCGEQARPRAACVRG
jgi:transposase